MRWSDLPAKARAFVPLVAFLVLALWAAVAFFDLAGDMREGDTERLDQAVLLWLAAHRSPALTELFLAITALGSGPVTALLTFGTCVALLLAGERRFALTLLVIMVGTAFLGAGLKRVYGRERPSLVPSLETVTDPSYPSAHTIASIAFFVTIALLAGSHIHRRPLRLFLVGYALLIATLVAVSRVYLGVHFPSDVAGGALIGIACSLCGVIVDRLLRGTADEPRADPGAEADVR